MREPMHLSMSSVNQYGVDRSNDEDWAGLLPRGKICEAIRFRIRMRKTRVLVGPEPTMSSILGETKTTYCLRVLSAYPTQHEISIVLEMSSDHEN